MHFQVTSMPMGRMVVVCLIRCFIILNMNQRFLTNFSVVVIKYMDQDEAYCLGNESFIRNPVPYLRKRDLPLQQ